MWKYLRRKASVTTSLMLPTDLPWHTWMKVWWWRWARGIVLLVVPSAGIVGIGTLMAVAPWYFLGTVAVIAGISLIYMLGSDSW